MRRFALPLVIAGCVALAAFLTWLAVSHVSFGRRVPPAPATAREAPVVRALPPFHRLDLSGSAEIELVQSDAESVSLPAGASRSGYLSAEVRDGTLYIESADASHWWDTVIGDGGRTQKVVVSFKNLDAITAAGTMRLRADRLKADSLKVSGAGGTVIRIDDLAARELRLSGSGALRADLAGRVSEQNVTISGAGDFRGAKLVSQDATVTVAGAGKVVVNAEKTLKATISGAGSVEYLGDPQVTERVSGAGRVRRREAASHVRSVALAD